MCSIILNNLEGGGLLCAGVAFITSKKRSPIFIPCYSVKRSGPAPDIHDVSPTDEHMSIQLQMVKELRKMKSNVIRKFRTPYICNEIQTFPTPLSAHSFAPRIATATIMRIDPCQ